MERQKLKLNKEIVIEQIKEIIKVFDISIEELIGLGKITKEEEKEYEDKLKRTGFYG